MRTRFGYRTYQLYLAAGGRLGRALRGRVKCGVLEAGCRMLDGCDITVTVRSRQGLTLTTAAACDPRTGRSCFIALARR